MIIRSVFDKINQYTSLRLGETKLGQVIPALKLDIHFIEDVDAVIEKTKAEYILLGIPEDIGVRANFGKAGTRKAFDYFVKYFVNTQQNKFIDESNIFIIGEIFVDDILKLSDQTEDIMTLRKYCEEIDNRCTAIVQKIVKAGKIPIVIGGGHNNSYGNIKGSSLALKKPIEVLNIDPHADFRIEEGRHSGNGFRYAYNQSYLSKYGIWGLHEGYNNHSILESLQDNTKFQYTTFENILMGKSKSLEDFLDFFGYKIGLEIDLDSIKNMPSSAISPVGFTEEEIIQFAQCVREKKSIIYYHFCEGSPNENEPYVVGKFLSYLVRSILSK